MRTARPKTYLEKLRYKMARDRRPLLHVFADKLESREYVTQKIGPSRLTLLHSYAPTFRELDWANIPDEFVLKVSHASGGVVVVSRSADLTSQLPTVGKEVKWGKYLVHPDSLDPRLLEQWVDRWLADRYHWRRGDYSQWAYSAVTPRVLVETYLGGEQGFASNLKLHCFAGTATSIVVSRLDESGKEHSEGRYLLTEQEALCSAFGLDPEEIQDVINSSEELAKETDFVRVDWLLTSEGIFFGELTSYPGAGIAPPGAGVSLSSEEVAALYGQVWTVPGDYDTLPRGTYPLGS